MLYFLLTMTFITTLLIILEIYNILSRGNPIDRIDKTLERANIFFTVEEILLVIGVSCVVAVLLGIVFTVNFVIGILFGVMTLLFYRVEIKRRIQKRIMKFDEQLGSTLDMLVSSLRGGFSFLNSMEVISRDMPEPNSTEFTKVLKEINLGLTQEKALNNLLERVPSEDLELIITASVIQTQTGGNLAEILDNISSTIRERVQLKRELKALTAQGKMSGWILGFLPVLLALFITILDPSYMLVLIKNPMGIILIVLALMNEIIGFTIIRKILDIQY